MVGKINPNDDSSKIPPSDAMSFHHDYTSPQQHVMNQHIAELKSLLKNHNPKDPDVQQRIATLRDQIQNEDLPAVGLSSRRKPTIDDAMEYIDKESGYSTHVENAAKEADAAASSKRSSKSKWRDIAGSAPISSKKTKAATKTTKAKLGTQDDDLSTLEAKIAKWNTDNPGKLTTQCKAIESMIEQFKSGPDQTMLTAASVRSCIQLSHDPNINGLFNTNIYNPPGTVSKAELSDFFNTAGIDQTLLPATSKPSAPPFRSGFVAYVFNNLPNTGPGGKETTVQVGGYMGNPSVPVNVLGFKPDGTPITGPTGPSGTLLAKHTLPTFTDSDGKQQSFVYVPAGMSSGRMYYNGTQNTSNTGFTEFTVDGNGVPYTNFTAVDGIPTLTSNVQMTGKNTITNRNGIQTDFGSFSNKMKSLYNQYDPSGTWAKHMFASDGSILSGKHMDAGTIGDPTIQTTFSDYLSGTFMQGMLNKPIYFLADGLPGKAPETRCGHITLTPDGKGMQFVIDGATSALKLPLTKDVNGWVSGAYGGAAPGDDDRTGAAKWGAAKAISSIFNKGILPSDINTTQDAPMDGSYFTNFNNIKTFYKATADGQPAYNLYLRSMHEAGCSAYGADFDDYMGGDGTVSDSPNDEPAITINFETTPPGPPPLTPTSFTTLADYKIALNNWLTQEAGDTDPKSAGITQTLLQALDKAENKGSLNDHSTIMDVQNWLQHTIPGRNALKYLQSPDVYSKDPGLANILAKQGSKAAQSTLQDLFDALSIPGQVPTPAHGFDPSADANTLWQNSDIKSKYQNAILPVTNALNQYNADLGVYNGSKTVANWNILQGDLTALVKIRNLAEQQGLGFNVLYEDPATRNEVISILGANAPTNMDQWSALGNAMDSNFIPGVPTLPPAPTPTPTTPTTITTIGDYLDAAANWLNNLGDTTQQPGIYQSFFTPLYTAVTSGPLSRSSTIVDVQNWLRTSPQGKQALSYLMSPDVYKNDAGLARIMAGPGGATAAKASLQDLFNQLSIPGQVPTPPGPPTPVTPTTLSLDFYKNQLLSWLKTNEGPNGYIRSNFINNIFGQIDSGNITSVSDMMNWLNNGPGKAMIKGLTSSSIYASDPDFANMDPKQAQTELQGLFKTLGITSSAPAYPTSFNPPGPPPTDDVAYLLTNNPNTVGPLYNNNTVPQLKTDIKNHASLNDMTNLINQHLKQYEQQLGLPGTKLPPGVTDIHLLAQELCRQEWKDAGAPGTCPV